MKEITKTILEDYPLNKITKLVLNRTMESETVVEGIIIDKGTAKVYLQGVQDSAKGKGLTEKKLIEGSFLMLLDKNNYNTLTEANYEYVQSEAIKGNKVEDLYKFISEDNGKYLVEI